MFFLKKSSIADIKKSLKSEDIFYSGINILEHYKEYEIFLTKKSLEDFFNQDGIDKNKIENLNDKLNRYKASIKAVHCPDSKFLTSSDKTYSTNYLSLDEVCNDEDSLKLLKKTILFAEAFSENNNPIVVILHAGSINGCNDESSNIPTICNDSLENLAKELKKLNIEKSVKIAIENVTPYVDINGKIPTGKNIGWGESYFKYFEYIDTLKSLSKKFENNILFGVCIDFCHLIADFKIINNECNVAEKCCEYIKSFMQKLSENNADIMLFHVSMFGEDGSHGRLFQYNNDYDNKLLETIRSKCTEYPNIPITLEMADGIDIDKACLNFDRMMYIFSAMHMSGDFGRMLECSESERFKESEKFKEYKEFKDFFENLFLLYTVPWSNMNMIQKLIFNIKQYIMKNSPVNENNDSSAVGGLASVFGFTYDENKENTALLRLKAYIVYTRFCNLGKYLATVYGKADFLFDRKNDFMLSMKYFMFCDDEIKQCVYTGVGYTFNMDFLPKRIENVYRFYDNIDENTIKPFKIEKSKDKHYFSQIVEGIRNQINGKNETFKLLSCGKNFFPCLMKYYQEPKNNHFTLRIYKEMKVNYVEVNEKKLSVPAFLHEYCYINKKFPEELNFVIDVSVFRNGRGNAESSSDCRTLAGFIKNLTNNEIIYENVGSVVDGEIVATKLPKKYNQYTLGIYEALGLVQVCKELNENNKKDVPIKSIEIIDNEEKSVTVDDTMIQEIEDIIKCVKTSKDGMTGQYTSYYNGTGTNLPKKYDAIKTIKIERVKDDGK